MRGTEIEIYEKLIRETKKVVDIPVIASINCSDKGEWISIAKELQDAGADALELNIAIAAFDRDIDPREIEKEYVDILKEVEKNINILNINLVNGLIVVYNNYQTFNSNVKIVRII